jgi:hypothetical protein
MDSMADAGVSSGAVNDAPFEDVSKFLLGTVSFLQTAPRPTAARWCVQIKVLREVPGRSMLFFGTWILFFPKNIGSIVMVRASHGLFSELTSRNNFAGFKKTCLLTQPLFNLETMHLGQLIGWRAFSN